MIKSRSSNTLALLTLLLTGFVLSGCEDMDVTPVPVAQELNPFSSYIQMAPTSPPQAPEETVPIPDNVRTQVWRPGYWHYNGISFDWVPGEMISRPSPTAIWSPDHWIEHTYGWAFLPGYWQ
jgi:hypothetical protein